jgi:TBPIP/Hop2 winged helix domain
VLINASILPVVAFVSYVVICYFSPQVLLRYLRLQNRPYSPVNIYDNIHGIIPKATIPKLLDELVAEKMLVRKDYGKLIIETGLVNCKSWYQFDFIMFYFSIGKLYFYWPSQDFYGVIDVNTLNELADTEATLRETAMNLSSRKKELQASYGALSKQPKLADLKQEAITLENFITNAENDMKRFLDPSYVPVSSEKFKEVVDTLKRYRKAWVSRKIIVDETLNQICENIDIMPKQLAIEMGLEFAEERKISLQQCVVPNEYK